MTKAKHSGFVKLDHELMDSPAWRTASPGVRCVVLAIWRRHNGANNGKIPYGRRDAQARPRLRVDAGRQVSAGSEERGFIVADQARRVRLEERRARSQGNHVADHDGALQQQGRHQRLGRLGSGRRILIDGSRSETTTGPAARPQTTNGSRSETRYPP